MQKRKILVTQALPYANGSLHLGHLVGMAQTDIWTRFQRMQGHDVTFVCGSDCHGTPIMIQAEKNGVSPEALIKEIHTEHARDLSQFLVEFDNFYSTHSPENKALVEMIFERHLVEGNINKRVIKQFYDPVKNMFLPDRYIKGECPNCHAKDQYGDNCEVCSATYVPTDLINPFSVLSGAKPVEKESEHYFFKLENYADFLKDWTRGNHLQAEVANKLDEWFKDGLREWDISRDAPYFGFTIPGEEHKYFYVWLDAPVGYIASFKNLCEKRKNLDFAEYWEKEETDVELIHFIGKDIIYFHALFWPAILKGACLRTPSKIYVNGYLTIEGQKMSKSRGTFIKAETYLKHFNPEYLRYYFATKLSDRIEDLDLNFTDFMNRINSDLVGKFVNIASRCASFINKNFNGQLSSTCADPAMFAEFAKMGDTIAQKYNNTEFSAAMRHIMTLADRANQYIDEKKPWSLNKDPAKQHEVQAVCTMGINLFRQLMIYLKPILPRTAMQVEKFLNISPLMWHDKDKPLLNHTICEFQPLLQRIDAQQLEAMKMSGQQDINDSNAPTPAAPTTEVKAETISIDDFKKIDLRVAKVLAAEEVEGADKLLRLQVDLGNDDKRQIFAGIKSAYKPEELIGRHVIVVANLAPRKMRFGESQGMMIVAVSGGNDLWIASPDPGAQAGMKVQ